VPKISQHHVARLEVAVQHARAVQDLERFGHLPHERERTDRGDTLLDAPAEVAERKVLHRDECVVVCDAEVVYPRHVRVDDRGGDLVLAQEPVEVPDARTLVGRLVQHLQRDFRPAALALRQVHARNRALGELADVAVAAYRRLAEPRRARRLVGPRGGPRELAAARLRRA
jgi:hypothetical protein